MRHRTAFCFAIVSALPAGLLLGQIPPLVISPTVLPTGQVGVSYLQTLSATGGVAPYTWVVLSGALPPGLTLSTAGTISGVPTASGPFSFQVRATDSTAATTPRTGFRNYTITVASPPLTITTTSLPPGTPGISYSFALSATGADGNYHWSVLTGTLPPGLGLAASGLIAGVPTSAGSYTFVAQVASTIFGQQPVTASRQYTLTISQPLTITTSQLQNGNVGIPFSQQFNATGGVQPYTWRVSSGSLPDGLTLSTSGLLSGIPAAPGTYSFSVVVTDTTQAYDSRTVSHTILPPTLTITTGPQLPNGTVGNSYSQQLSATGGYGNYTWSILSGTLPPGLGLSASGLIAGIPTSMGNSTFVVQVSSTQVGQQPVTATRTFSLSVSPAPLTVVTQQLPGGIAGAPYSQSLSATGGMQPYSWSISAGTLPEGLAMNSSGLISGTPLNPGTFSFTVVVADTRQATDARPLSITIQPSSLSVTTERLPDATAGVAYSFALTASGGASPYTWAVTIGALPDGLTLSPSGTISGTPTTVRTFTFTVQVMDSRQATATRSLTIVVVARVRITTSSPLRTGTIGSPYSQQLSASGGTPPYSWSVASGVLPGGLALGTSTGLITGTPETAGSYSVVLAVTDSARDSDRQTFAITVVQALSITTSSPLPDGLVASAYSQQLNAAGGAPPYQWSVNQGALPAGLTLSAASGVISGTPSAAGAARFTAQVSDSAGNRATRDFVLTVNQGLLITTTDLPGGTIGTAYYQQLAATGGTPPYTWSVSEGSLPPGITLTASSGLLSGTPGAAGTFRFTISVTDASLRATRAYSVVISVPPTPPIQITGLPASAQPATQPQMTITLGSAYPVDMTGRATLVFAPESGPDDPAIQFTTGGRAADFRVPAGSTQAVFGVPSLGIQTGTVAGAITVTLRLQAGGVDITPTPAPAQTMRIARGAPVIVSASLTRTATGFDLLVTGYATSREVNSATVRYTPASGVTLSTSEAAVPLSTVFAAWYQSSSSAPYGSQFLLRIPFSVQGTANPVTSVSVSLTNAQGTSAPVNASF